MSTSYGLGFEPFPLLIGYELGDWLHLRTDDTKDALTLGSHMNSNISDINEELEEMEENGADEAATLEMVREKFRDFVSRLVRGGEGDTLGSLYYSLLHDYAEDEDKRAWLRGKGLHLPVVPFSDEPNSNSDAVPDLAPELRDGYRSQVDDLFRLFPGFTEDGKPCVWVHPGDWRSVRVSLVPGSYYNPPLLRMCIWDWDGGHWEEVTPEVASEARDTWLINGYLDRREVLHPEGVHSRRRETEYFLPEETRAELERSLRRSGAYGKNVKLEARVLPLNGEEDLYCNPVCKAVVRVG